MLESKIVEKIRLPSRPEPGEQRLEIFRQRRMKFHVFARRGVEKAEDARVQRLPLKRKRLPGRAVDRISQKRMADACHVHADLVRAPRLQRTFQIRIGAEPLQDAVMGYRIAPVSGIYAHFLAVHRMAADGRPDGSFLLRKAAEDDGVIFAGNRVNL